MNSDNKGEKTVHEKDEFINSITRHIGEIQTMLDDVASKTNLLEDVSEDILNIQTYIAIHSESVVKLKHELKLHENSIKKLNDDLNYKKVEKSNLLETIRRSPLYKMKERLLNHSQDNVSEPADIPSYSLAHVYNSKDDCYICCEKRAGKDFVYSDACPHRVCKLCLSRIKLQTKCVQCRQPVKYFFTIIRCGELCRLKSFKTNYNFLEDRPFTTEELRDEQSFPTGSLIDVAQNQYDDDSLYVVSEEDDTDSDVTNID